MRCVLPTVLGVFLIILCNSAATTAGAEEASKTPAATTQPGAAAAKSSAASDAARGYRVADLAWLAGFWSSDACEEFWTPPSVSGMSGVCRMEKGQKQPIFEILLLEQTEQGVYYRLKHYGPGLAEAKIPDVNMLLVELDGEKAVFEDPAKDFPRRIIYHKTGPDKLDVRLEGERNGKPRGFGFSLTRQAGR